MRLGVLALGRAKYGAQSWIGSSTLSFQPTEPTKLVLVVALAAYWSRTPDEERSWREEGTTQEQVAKGQQARCGAKPLTLRTFDRDTEALLQVKSGAAVADQAGDLMPGTVASATVTAVPLGHVAVLEVGSGGSSLTSVSIPPD